MNRYFHARTRQAGPHVIAIDTFSGFISLYCKKDHYTTRFMSDDEFIKYLEQNADKIICSDLNRIDFRVAVEYEQDVYYLAVPGHNLIYMDKKDFLDLCGIVRTTRLFMLAYWILVGQFAYLGGVNFHQGPDTTINYRLLFGGTVIVFCWGMMTEILFKFIITRALYQIAKALCLSIFDGVRECWNGAVKYFKVY